MYAIPADSHILRTRAMGPEGGGGPLATAMAAGGGGDEGGEIMTMGEDDDREIVCKFAPYRVCYIMGVDGKLRPMRRAQPVSIMRVYKRSGRK